MRELRKLSLLLTIIFAPVSCRNTDKVSMRLDPISQRPILDSDLLVDQESNATKHGSTKRHIVIATLELEPFMMKRYKDERNDTFEWHGYCMDFFNELIKHLPYEVTYEIYQVPDNRFGSKSRQKILDSSGGYMNSALKVEKWNGLVGDLHEGRAHLALAPIAVMAERELAIDFTVPFYDLVGIQILLKKPEVPQDWFKFLTVLDREVWFSITLAYFVTSFIMFLFDRLSPYSHKNMSRIQKLKKSRKSRNPSEKSTKLDGINSVSGKLKTASYSIDSNNRNKMDQIMLPANEFSSTSHQLFVSPLGNQQGGPRRGSAFFLTGFDPNANGWRNGSAPGSAGPDVKSGQIYNGQHRTSKTLSDFFRKSIGGWDMDEFEESDSEDGKPDFGFRDSLWFCITSLTPQGGGEAPQNLSGRVVAGAWWLFCFIIIASYTANLAAFLTVSRLDIPIESLDDLAKQYRIKYAPIDGSAEQTYFERMAYIEEIFYNIWKDMSLNESLSEEERSKFAVWDYPISDKYTKIWAQIQQVGMPPDAQAGIKRVKSSTIDDGFALLADANMVRHAVMTDCSFKAVGEEFSRKPIALGVRKGDDQFRDDLSYAILQLINQRFMEILREKWWTNNPNRVTCDNNDESEGISIENIVGVFIIIFAGVLLSFFVWAIERFVYKNKVGVAKDLIQKL